MQALGWTLVLGGVALLVGFWAYFALAALLTETPIIVRVGVAGMLGGFAFLLASVIRDRIRERQTERFEEHDQ